MLAASFASDQAPASELTAQRGLTTLAEQWLAKDGLESRSLFRVAKTVPEGLLQTLLGENATLLVSEWRTRDRLRPDSEASEALARTPVPVLLVHGDIENFDRLLVVARRDQLVRPGLNDVELAKGLAAAVATHRRVGLLAAALDPVNLLFAAEEVGDRFEAADPIDWLRERLLKTDLAFFGGMDAAREAMARIPALANGRFLVAVAANATTLHKREQRVAGPVTVDEGPDPNPPHTEGEVHP